VYAFQCLPPALLRIRRRADSSLGPRSRFKSQPLNLCWFPTRVIIWLPTCIQLSRGKRPVKVDFDGSPVMSDGGLILVQELDGPLGLDELTEPSLRQKVYSPLASYEDSSASRVTEESRKLSRTTPLPSRRFEKRWRNGVCDPLRDHGIADSLAACAREVGRQAGDRVDFSGQGSWPGKSAEVKGQKGAVAVCGVLTNCIHRCFRRPWKRLAFQTLLTIAFGGGPVYVFGRAGGRGWSFWNK
jgi:hypothetical protein